MFGFRSNSAYGTWRVDSKESPASYKVGFCEDEFMNCRLGWSAVLGAVVFVFLLGGTARADQTFCVTDLASLDNALSTWSLDSNNETVHVKVQTGTYDLSQSSDVGAGAGAIYSQIYEIGSSADPSNAALDLQGGFSSGCTHQNNVAVSTILDGKNVAALQLIGTGYMSVKNFTVQNLRGESLSQNYAIQSTEGLLLSGFGTVTVQNVIAHDVTTIASVGQGPSFSVDVNGSSVNISDSLFYNDTCTGTTDCYAVYLPSGFIVNTTVTDNPFGGVIAGYAGQALNIINSILYNNNGMDFTAGYTVAVAGGGFSASGVAATCKYADLGTYVRGSGNSTIFDGPGFISTDPIFEAPASHDYTLHAGAPMASPAINLGDPSAADAGGYPPTDLKGSQRIVGSRIDMGPYESNLDDATTLLVTSTADNSNSNTLRGAITQANANFVFNHAPQHIEFNFPTCGNTITLTSKLPDILPTVYIDGYSLQTGATYNTLSNDGSPGAQGFNAQICVTIDGGNSVAYAFHTPTSATSSQVSIAGIAFVNFTDSAIKFEGGSDHWVRGNIFGNNNRAVYVSGSAGNALIGGTINAGYVNAIGYSSDAAVKIDSSVGGTSVDTNLIGVYVDGVSNAGNQVGVYVTNSPANVITRNQISFNNLAGVFVTGAGSKNELIGGNYIGVIAGTLGSGGNSGPGIQIDNGASGTVVGMPYAGTGPSFGNYIGYNNGPGVWVTAGAGNSNTIIGNAIYRNQGLAVDLGALGPDANGSPSGGANAMQAFPTIKNAFYTSAADWVEISLQENAFPATDVQIDLYASAACSENASQRGDENVYIGPISASPDSSGLVHRWVKFPPQTFSGFVVLSATATTANGNTSDIGNCASPSNDLVFRDDFGG